MIFNHNVVETSTTILFKFLGWGGGQTFLEKTIQIIYLKGLHQRQRRYSQIISLIYVDPNNNKNKNNNA